MDAQVTEVLSFRRCRQIGWQVRLGKCSSTGSQPTGRPRLRAMRISTQVRRGARYAWAFWTASWRTANRRPWDRNDQTLCAIRSEEQWAIWNSVGVSRQAECGAPNQAPAPGKRAASKLQARPGGATHARPRDGVYPSSPRVAAGTLADHRTHM